MYQLSSFLFPKNFKFGVADTNPQVIGEQQNIKSEVSDSSRWTHLAKTSGKVYNKNAPLEEIHYYNQ